ncbi:hypothetical protein BMS3Abin16_00184 [archaeon BMS3Abin16]|nr:hypothetical protein BMS3Abin16_00184 [archaeon BMS3Abin16]
MEWKYISTISVLAVLFVLFASVQPVVSVDDTQATTASVTVNEYISVTLAGVPIAFGSLNPGVTDSAATSNPTTITVDSVTNVATNISLNGSIFTGPTTFGVGNLSFANDTTSTQTDMTTVFSSGLPYSNWVNIPAPGGGASETRNAYFWIDIPSGQTAGGYSSDVFVRVEKA